MVYIILGIAGLLVSVALFTYINLRKGEESEPISAPEAGCCGAHAICEKGLKKINPQTDYFEDEELDALKGISPEHYSDEQVEQFRDVLYTLRKEEIEDWMISLAKREIQLPVVLKAEVLDLLKD